MPGSWRMQVWRPVPLRMRAMRVAVRAMPAAMRGMQAAMRGMQAGMRAMQAAMRAWRTSMLLLNVRLIIAATITTCPSRQGRMKCTASTLTVTQGPRASVLALRPAHTSIQDSTCGVGKVVVGRWLVGCVGRRVSVSA